jgi:hypothetical protein
MPLPSQVRIVRDKHSQDGYIAKTRSNRVCFIRNITDKIESLAAGQLWDYKIVSEQARYSVINLLTLKQE